MNKTVKTFFLGFALLYAVFFSTYSAEQARSGDIVVYLEGNRTEKALFTNALHQWDQHSKIDFVHTNDRSKADLVLSAVDTFAIKSPTGGKLAGRFNGWTRRSGKIIVNHLENTSSLYFLNTALHEIGHFLGLKHTDARNSVMAAYGGEKSAQRYGDKLRPVDIKALKLREKVTKRHDPRPKYSHSCDDHQ